MSPIAVVLGARGGIGRAAVDLLATDPRYGQVFAVARQAPQGSLADRVTWLIADGQDEAALARAAETAAAAGQLSRVLVATGRLHGPGLVPEKSLSALDAGALVAAFEANTVVPALAAKHFAPRFPREKPSVFAVLSARLGSLGDNRLGGWHGYRMAKAALNMLVRNLALELARSHPQAVCVALHPGTTATPLSEPFVRAAERPEVTAGRLIALMHRLTPEHSGGFYAYDGTPIPW